MQNRKVCCVYLFLTGVLLWPPNGFSSNPFHFSTKYYDQEVGLYNFGYRHYDPNAGRWLNRDPFEEGGGGANLYGYVNNNPMMGIDPDGRFLALPVAGLIYETAMGAAAGAVMDWVSEQAAPYLDVGGAARYYAGILERETGFSAEAWLAYKSLQINNSLVNYVYPGQGNPCIAELDWSEIGVGMIGGAVISAGAIAAYLFAPDLLDRAEAVTKRAVKKVTTHAHIPHVPRRAGWRRAVKEFWEDEGGALTIGSGGSSVISPSRRLIEDWESKGMSVRALN